ncbi:MAG: cytochrome C [Chitinophagaceae bacterium]
MQNESTVFIYMDDDTRPIGEYKTPINFELDTTKLVDGAHILKIVSKSWLGKEGIRNIPFTVRNGPAIAIEGIKENTVVDGVLPLMINAYTKGDQKSFIIAGSETPHSISAWLWVVIVLFVGWSMYFLITSLSMDL